MRWFLFRLLGVLEISGGLYGLGAMLRQLLPLGSTWGSLYAILGLALFAFVLVAGVHLVAGQESGVRLSRLAQLLQLPLLATPMLSYALHCGAYINIYTTFSLARPWLDWNFATQGLALALDGPASAFIGINLLALCSWLILQLR